MLLKYELKKLLTNRMNLIAMVIGFIILGLTTIYPVMSESEYIMETDESLKGIEAIEYNQKKAESQTEYLTDEYVNQVIAEIQTSGLDLSSDDGFLCAFDRYGKLFPYLVNSYKDIKDENFNPELITDINLEKMPSFYSRRVQRIEEYLNLDFSFGNFTDVEKEYWLAKANKVQTPYKWGDTFVPKHYANVIALGFYFSFVIIICLSGVFAGEHEKNVAGIILASKTGQRKLVFAKIQAAICFSLGYVCILYSIAGIWTYITIGCDGFYLPVQLLSNEICYDMNLAQYLGLQMVMSVICIIFTTVLTLFLSALTKTSLGTMALMLVIMVGPAFIPFSKDSGLINHINALAIIRIVDVKEVLRQFWVYRLGNVIINLPTFAIIIYALITLAMTMMIRKIFVDRSLRD